MRMRRITPVLICFLALVLCGCGLGQKVETAKKVAGAVVEEVQEAATEVAVEEAQEDKEETTDTPAPKKEEAEPKEETQTSVEAEEEEIPELRSTEDLKSYRQEIKTSVKIDGDLDNEFTMMAEFDKDTPAMRFVMKGVDENGQEYETENIHIGDTMYTRYDDQWMAMEVPDQNVMEEMSPWAQHESWVDDDCKRKGKENIAGESCIHYVCDVDPTMMAPQAVLEGASGITDIQGEFWVSTKHNVTIKSIITWEGTEEGKKVSYRHESLITDIDKTIKIEKPEGVQEPGAGDDLPVYPNAIKTMAMPGMSTYEVEALVDDVSDWYKKELEKAGYSFKADESMPPMILGFANDDESLQLMLNQDGPKVTIMMMAEPQEQ